MKKLSLFLTALVLLTLLAGCNTSGGSSAAPSSQAGTSSSAPSSAPPASTFPENKPITLICPWSAGGGSDIGARMVVPYMEEKLGTTVNVTNPTGASGWVGWEQMLAGKADGYTIALINLPTLYPGYLDPSLGRDKTIDDFQMLGNHVTDSSVIAINANETRFTDLESFIEYAKNNEVTMATSGVGTDDHIMLQLFNAALGTNITMVPGGGWVDGYAALLGGHVDCSAANIGEVLVPEGNNEIKAIVVFSDGPSNLMPHVPVWNELGLGDNIIMSSQRGFACKAGTPQEIVDALSEALEYAITNETQIAKMAEMGLDVDYIGPEDYTVHVKNEEARMMSMSDIMGW